MASRIAFGLVPLLLAGTLASAAEAQTAGSNGTPSTPSTPATRPATTGKLSHADEAFLQQAAQNGHAEIEGSKLALARTGDAQVKAFAQQMVSDHTKMGAEVAALGARKGLQLPLEPSLLQKAKLKVLDAADRDSFDQRYAGGIGVEAHEDTLAMFQKAARSARDPDVKALATQAVPKLEHHLRMARELKAAVDTERSAQAGSPHRTP